MQRWRGAAVALFVALVFAGCVSTPSQKAADHSAAREDHAAASTHVASPPDGARYADRDAVEALSRAIEQRLDIMRDVAAAKYLSGAPVQDAAREAVVLQRVAARAQALGLDVATTQEFFAVQMRIARVAQEHWLARWRAAGRCEPCAEPPQLQAVREWIDDANERQLAALYIAAPLHPNDAFVISRELQAALVQRELPDHEAKALAAAAADVRRSQTGNALSRIRATGILRIATTGDYAPFSLESGGHLTGADIALARQLATHLGVEPKFVRTSWPGLLNDLHDGRFDVAISGIGVTPERAALGAYSAAAYQAGGKTLLARCADRERFDTPEELDRPGNRVIVNPGGTNERYVREHVRRAQVIVHPDNRGVFAEIAAGRADVMVTDDVEAELQARRWPGQLCRTYAGTLTQGEKRILMVRDAGLQQVVDEWLRERIAAGEPARVLEQAMREYVDAAATR